LENLEKENLKILENAKDEDLRLKNREIEIKEHEE